MLEAARRVTHVTALGVYSKVYFQDDTLLANSGISTLVDKMSALRFQRVHRSHLVNMNQAMELSKEGRYWYLIVAGGTPVRVSDSYLAEIRRQMV